ncbi:hypothetical protein D9M72_619000 [compost metagenome]
MHDPSRSKVLVRWHGQPGGKGPVGAYLLGPADAEDAGGIEVSPQHGRYTPDLAIPVATRLD